MVSKVVSQFPKTLVPVTCEHASRSQPTWLMLMRDRCMDDNVTCSAIWPTLWIRNFQWLIFFFVYIFLSMLSGDFLLCHTFWSKYLWIFLAIHKDYSYFDAQVRCTYLVPNMTLTLMFIRNSNNLRYSIKKNKVTFTAKILFIEISLWIFPKTLTIKITNWLHDIYLWVMLSQLVEMDFQISKLFS